MIIIAFYEGKSLLSKVIQWETRSKISHVSILQLPDAAFDWMTERINWRHVHAALDTCPLWEAWGVGGVVKRTGIHEGHTPGTMIRLMRLEAVDHYGLNESAVVAMLEKTVARGTGYDWWGLVRFAARINRDNDKRMFCSELVHLAMQAGGVPLLRRVGAHFVAPGDLYRSPIITELSVTKTKNAVKAPKTRCSHKAGVCPKNRLGKTCRPMELQTEPVLGVFPPVELPALFRQPFTPPNPTDDSTGPQTPSAASCKTATMQNEITPTEVTR